MYKMRENRPVPWENMIAAMCTIRSQYNGSSVCYMWSAIFSRFFSRARVKSCKLVKFMSGCTRGKRTHTRVNVKNFAKLGRAEKCENNQRAARENDDDCVQSGVRRKVGCGWA